METQLLKDPDVFPTKEILEKALGKSFLAYEELVQTITEKKYGLEPVWNYYNDGKAWLCKVCYKKKTVFWLSVWDKYFKIGFYFTEKNCAGIDNLEINKNIKDDFKLGKPIGKLLPLTLEMKEKEQITDLLKIIEYKKNLK